MANQTPRPKFLNFLVIRFPVGAITSIGHRLSGALLFLSLPVAIFLLERSLQSPQGYDEVQLLLHNCPLRLLVILVIWAFSHHLLAGIRFLLIDFEWGVQKRQARMTAWLVNLSSFALLLLLFRFFL